jgi:ABC-2 type transport system ATP-binding protein
LFLFIAGLEKLLMSIVTLDRVSKSFGPVKAVDNISLDIEKGEIFGLLGPNGAGKTTAIRIILDIFKPDHGKVSVLGGPMDQQKKDRIGYLPEERGLYQDISLERCLVYLGSLKGLSPSEARTRAEEYMDFFDLSEYKHKKVKELSRGMQQKAQLITALLHKPELIIVDEPFSGLDPVNTQIVKDLLRNQRDDGVTIIMSTHQMHQVEEMCDRIVLIDQGRILLYGRLDEIQRQFSGNAVIVSTTAELTKLPGVLHAEPFNSFTRLTLTQEASPKEILQELVKQDADIERFEIAAPRLDEIFIQVVQREGVLKEIM